MSDFLSAEIAATCNALGYYDQKENKYYADGNTVETVKDLIRYLRRDDDSHDIRRQLGETKVVQTDLLQLLKNLWEQDDIFDVVLRVLVNLTTPALVLWNEEVPTERAARNYYLQIEEHLQSYKQAFADEAVWAVLSTKLSKILEIDFAERGDENSLVIERILILIRNVLYVPADPDSERRPDNDASVHDQVLWALHQSGMLDIILYITSSDHEQAYYMHVLEILSFMLREQSASELAQAAIQRSQTEKLRDEAELLAIRHRETHQRQQKVKMYNGARHSRFGGTFVVKSMKSISDNELIYHKPLNKLDALNFDAGKKKVKTPKNRRPIQDSTTERRSAFSVRLILKEFCVEFLNGAYNNMMYQVKNKLTRAKAQQHDESYYLWAIRFFMEFNRCYKFEVKLVSETMSVQSFHFVQQQMENYFDMINTDKKKLRLWSRRLHLALLAYKELLLTICSMDKSPDGSVRDSAKVIKSNIFYVLEYRELILTLLVTFDELKMSRTHLKDLLETQHIFFKMFQSYCGGKSGQVVVQKKAKMKRKKSKPTTGAATVPQINLESKWDEAGPQLSTVLEGTADIPTDVVPFDATSDVPIDEQKSECMLDIQRKLRDGDYENAVGLLRAAREVWPENDCFGSNNMAPEEEFLALRDIFFADLGENQTPIQEETQPEEYEEDEEDDLVANMDITETDFKFEDFAKRLAHPKVVQACSLALQDFEKNSPLTNHCVIKLLHRIAWDCKMYAMIFQASIFRTFQKIYEAKTLPQFKELVKFATYIIRQFLKVAEKNPKVFMEALFWKSSRDAFDVEEGYGSYQEKASASNRAWTEIEEDELRKLFMEHQEKQETQDVVDWIINNLIDNTRTRRGVLKKLKEMYLLTDYKGPRKSGVSTQVPRQWGEDEEAQLRELYEQFRDASDPLGCIMDRLDVHRPKNRIVEKLLVMGLVQDKKELRKKRSRKSEMPHGQSRRRDGNSDNEDSESSDSEVDNVRSNSPISTGQTRKNKQTSGAKKSRAVAKRSSKNTKVSWKELAKLLIASVDAGLEEALEWIRESFSDAAEDMENDPSDDDESGVPIVPILDCAIQAMENPLFQKLLKAFGIQRPFDEQESYWRIPSNFTSAKLREHCELLSQAIEKTLQVDEDQPTQDSVQEGYVAPAESSDDEDIFDRVRNMVNRNESNESENEGNNATNLERSQSNSQSTTTLNEASQSSVRKKKTKRLILNDSDDESDKVISQNLESSDKEATELSEKESETGENSESLLKYKKSRRVILNDSEDESDKENVSEFEIQENEVNEESAKRLRSLSDSEDEQRPKLKKTKILESDDED